MIRGTIAGMRAALYVRISADPEGRELGVARQEEDCRALAQRLGLEVVAVFADNDVSASTRSTKKRPRYDAMLESARAGEFGAILAYSNSRLTRRPREVEDLIELAERDGVRLHTVVSGDDDLSTADGRMVARIKGNVDTAESERTSERAQRAKLQAAQAGRYRGGPRPFGYRRGGLEPEPLEAAALRGAAESIAAGGSLRSAASRIAADGFTSSGRRKPGSGPDGPIQRRPIDALWLRRVLLRPRNAGLLEHRGGVVGPAEWPAIVPEPLWRAVCAILTDPSRRTNSGASGRRNLLSGVATCDVCGSRIIATGTSSRAGNPRRVYACSGERKCVTRARDVVDAYVREVAKAYLREHLPDLMRADGSADAAALADAQANADGIRREMDALAAQTAAGTLTVAQLVTINVGLRERLDATEAAIARARERVRFADLADAPDPGEAFENLPLDRQSAALAALFTITIKPQGRGRPKGWRPGMPYFDPDSVDVTARRSP
ncbi:Resolvase domain protein [Beutenbergia cavernae DSM 12333]|uniref:Resolvase domain protein n=2 Tax=Beutenbergia TaxID=84756 RepID=C5BWV1_BEUC1|nr:Resolvase domain protein [Beutenbergia cavernae DSM 12333]